MSSLRLPPRDDMSTSGQHVWMFHLQPCIICIISEIYPASPRHTHTRAATTTTQQCDDWWVTVTSGGCPLRTVPNAIVHLSMVSVPTLPHSICPCSSPGCRNSSILVPSRMLYNPPNLGLVFVYILCYNIFMFIGAHFVVFHLVSSEPTQMFSREERLQSDLFCVKRNTKLIKSINVSASE